MSCEVLPFCGLPVFQDEGHKAGLLLGEIHVRGESHGV